MRYPYAIAGLTLVLGMSGAALAKSPAPNTKLSQAQCVALWRKVNPSAAATVDASQTQAYITNFAAADPDNDGTLSEQEFQVACAKNLVHDSAASTGAASGTQGAGVLRPAESPDTSGSAMPPAAERPSNLPPSQGQR